MPHCSDAMTSSRDRHRRRRRRADPSLRAYPSPCLIECLRIYAKRCRFFAVLHCNDQPPRGNQRGEPAYETAYRRWCIPREPTQQELEESEEESEEWEQEEFEEAVWPLARAQEASLESRCFFQADPAAFSAIVLRFKYFMATE